MIKALAIIGGGAFLLSRETDILNKNREAGSTKCSQWISQLFPYPFIAHPQKETRGFPERTRGTPSIVGFTLPVTSRSNVFDTMNKFSMPRKAGFDKKVWVDFQNFPLSFYSPFQNDSRGILEASRGSTSTATDAQSKF